VAKVRTKKVKAGFKVFLYLVPTERGNMAAFFLKRLPRGFDPHRVFDEVHVTGDRQFRRVIERVNRYNSEVHKGTLALLPKRSA
jgi:hypothetical protein